MGRLACQVALLAGCISIMFEFIGFWSPYMILLEWNFAVLGHLQELEFYLMSVNVHVYLAGIQELLGKIIQSAPTD